MREEVTKLGKSNTCGKVARGARTNNVHHSKSNQLLVPINIVILEHGKASPYSYSFLRT
jgi:hypothetical protein